MCERERRERTQKHILCAGEGGSRTGSLFIVTARCPPPERSERPQFPWSPCRRVGFSRGRATEPCGRWVSPGKDAERGGSGHRLASPTLLPSHPMCPPPRDTATVSESGPSERPGSVGELGSSRQKYRDGAKTRLQSRGQGFD